MIFKIQTNIMLSFNRSKWLERPARCSSKYRLSLRRHRREIAGNDAPVSFPVTCCSGNAIPKRKALPSWRNRMGSSESETIEITYEEHILNSMFLFDIAESQDEILSVSVWWWLHAHTPCTFWLKKPMHHLWCSMPIIYNVCILLII